MTSYRTDRINHRGTTILEVLFSMGIAIVGILGIASILPLAARNAMQANEASEGQSYALHYYSDFVVRGFNQMARWRWYNDQAAVAVRYSAYDNTSPLPSGTSVASTRTPYRHAICIDPGFFSDPSTLDYLQQNSFGAAQAYRPGLFPYYQDNFDPTSNPGVSPSFLGQDLPRLLRVNLADTSLSPARLLSGKAIQQLFSSRDDVTVTMDEKDKTIPPIRYFETGATRGLTNELYSWLATLSPREPLPGELVTGAETKYTLSVVVMHRRDRALFATTGDSKNDIPQGERVAAIVSGPAAFVGGSGGRIELSANIGIDDTVRIGDWLMLAKYTDIAPPRATICRWYRVIGVDQDSILTGTGPNDTWTRNVVLEGPDWNFSTGSPTQATIVSNVVTVLERVVDIQ